MAQAQPNRAPRGRKRDFPDAERLVKRLVARELTLSFVPDAEQRLVRKRPESVGLTSVDMFSDAFGISLLSYRHRSSRQGFGSSPIS